MRRLVVSMLMTAALVTSAAAAELRPYTASALQADQAAGKPIIVHVTAPWCGTCAAQMPVVKALLKSPRYRNLVVLNVDFDKQKDALRKLHVQAQSTFVAFKGKTEVGRSTGETERGSIQSLFDKTS